MPAKLDKDVTWTGPDSGIGYLESDLARNSSSQLALVARWGDVEALAQALECVLELRWEIRNTNVVPIDAAERLAFAVKQDRQEFLKATEAAAIVLLVLDNESDRNAEPGSRKC